MHTFRMGWNHKLKNAISRRGLTTTEIARRFDVTQSAASKWLNGINEPSYAVLLSLCQMTGLTVSYVLDDSQPDDGPSQIGEILSQEIARLGQREALAVLLQATRPAFIDETRILGSRNESHLESSQPPRHHKRPKKPRRPSGGGTSSPPSAGGPDQR
jgi:transcriptional regulator with XRE-family HTH domain